MTTIEPYLHSLAHTTEQCRIPSLDIQAGHEVILLCEKDPIARQILGVAFPGTLIEDDVARLSSLPKETTCLVAGFPCIDVSRAGKRLGLNGPATGLVHHVFRLLQQFKRDHGRPVPWVLLENVQALLDRRGKEAPPIQYILNQFVELGYASWAYRVVSSAGFGLPNRRKRVFIIASLDGDARDVLLAQVSSSTRIKMHVTDHEDGKQFMGVCLLCYIIGVGSWDGLIVPTLEKIIVNEAFPHLLSFLCILILILQGPQKCMGGCKHLFAGSRCYGCHQKHLDSLQTFSGTYVRHDVCLFVVYVF